MCKLKEIKSFIACHLHGVLERRLRVGRDVSLDVVLAGDAAESDAEKVVKLQIYYKNVIRVAQAVNGLVGFHQSTC